MDAVEVVRSIYEDFNRRDYGFLDRIAEDMQVTVVPLDQVFRGPEGFREFTDGFTEAFPDVRAELTTIFGNGDQVAAEFRVLGTHTATMRTPAGDVPATGKQVDFQVAEVWELQDGRVVRLRNYMDAGALMRQLGLA
jgi:steroid delta-isomerase-like uncharacterized protein